MVSFLVQILILALLSLVRPCIDYMVRHHHPMQASSPSTFGGISVSGNPQNVKLGEGFNFPPASAGPDLFGKTISSAQNVSFQFSGSNVSTLASATTSNPIQSNIFSATPVMNFGAQGHSTLKSGLLGSQRGGHIIIIM